AKNRTVSTIRAAIDLRWAAPMVNRNKRQALALRANELVLDLVIPKAAYVISGFIGGAFLIVHPGGRLTVGYDAIGFALGRLQHGIIAVVPIVGYQLLGGFSGCLFNRRHHGVQLLVIHRFGRRF